MANGIGGPGVGMGGPSGPGGPAYQEGMMGGRQRQAPNTLNIQYNYRGKPLRETPEQRRKREEEERKEREKEERRRGRSLLTGYTAPNPRRRTLLAGGALLAGENQSPQIY